MENKNFYDGIVQNLKEEASHLNTKLSFCRNKHDMNTYIATLKSLRETLHLIETYDWRLIYSEYETVDSDGCKQVSVWEQNGTGEIRNHKIWKVSN